MGEHDNLMRRDALAARLTKLSPAQQALFEKLRRGQSSTNSPPPAPAPPIERVPRRPAMPLTFSLESLLEQKWWDSDVRENNLRRCFRLMGAFSRTAMEQTLNELARRHEALRTTMPLVDGRPAMVIAPPSPLTLPVIELQDVPEPERPAEALRRLAAAAQRPYDLSHDTLWRILLARLDENDHMLLLSMSHLISDTWSMELLVKETLTLYQAFSTGAASPLAELPIQFADYAAWQRSMLQGAALENLVSYWRRQLEGIDLIPETRLPIERRVEEGAGGRTIVSQQLQLPPDLSDSLKKMSQREGVTIFMVLVAALVTVLHRYTGKDDFGIPAPMAKRTQPETRGVIGWFADFIVLRIRLSGVETFSALLQRVRDVMLEAFEHQDLPFAKFSGNSPEMWQKAETYPSVRMDILIGAEMQEAEEERQGGVQMPQVAIFPVRLPPFRAKNAALPGITVSAQENERRLDVSLSYEEERYEAAAIRELLENYRSVLEGAVERAGQGLKEFSFKINGVEQ